MVLVVLALAGSVPVLLAGEEGPGGGTLLRPIDPRQQTVVVFGVRSHWLQPWRGYLDTFPATRLLDAIGINFNVEPSEAEATARMLARNGFRRARIEIGWDRMSYNDPAQLGDKKRLRALVGALARHGIRPLVLLNSNQGIPCPVRRFGADLAEPAEAGATSVRLTPASATQVVPGRSGIDGPGYKAAGVLFTGVSPDGTATLSKPLPQRLNAGPNPATTLRYEPFGPPRLADGSPNPRFEETLAGWLLYVRAVVRETRAVVGSQDFDVEIWNELTFGSDFLDQGTYYQPAREEGQGRVTDEILFRTVAALRAPTSPAPRIGIGNGFASQTPFPAGSNSPPGLTAIDKHPYYGIKRFPQDAVFDGIAPLDALGQWSFDEQTSPQGAAGASRPVRAALRRLLPRVHPHCDPDGDDDPRHLADHHGRVRNAAWAQDAPARRRRRRRSGSPRPISIRPAPVRGTRRSPVDRSARSVDGTWSTCRPRRRCATTRPSSTRASPRCICLP